MAENALTFWNRFEAFLLSEDRMRWKAAGWAIAIGGTIGSIQMALSNSSIDDGIIAMLVAVLLSSVVWVGWHCDLQHRSESELIPLLSQRMLIALSTTASLSLIIGVVLAPRIEAAVVGTRLLRLTNHEVLSEGSAAKVGENLDIAQRWHVPLPESTLIQLRDNIKRSALHTQEPQGVAIAADALGNYYRDSLQNLMKRNPEWAVEYIAAIDHQATAADNYPLTPAESDAALAAFSRAIERSKGNPELIAQVLTSKALLNMARNKPEEALSDARSAEKLGALDLPLIFFIEGTSLARHQNSQEDLRSAVQYLRLADQRQPLLAPFPHYHAIIALDLSVAYSGLGDWGKACTYDEKSFELLPRTSPQMDIEAKVEGGNYRRVIICRLRLGNYQGALSAANQYAHQFGPGEAVVWRNLVTNYPSDPAAVLAQLQRMQ